MARSYYDRESGRDDDWRDRDERRFRYGGQERGRYDVSDREREHGEPPEWARDPGYGWSNDRGSNDRQYDEHRSREYWRSRENSPWRANEPGRGGESWRSSERYGSRGYAGEYAPNENRWSENRWDEAQPQRGGRTTLHGLGSGNEQWGSAFPGWGRPQENRRGGFAGKGPRGYTRSDDRIREDVCDRLSADDEVDASDITVTVLKGEVTLEGTVPDRHSKRRAEDIVESVTGVSDVHNRLRANKGLVQEVGDKLMGRPNESGHAGSGTRNQPGTSVQNNH